MKYKLRRTSKRSLSMVLAILIAISTLIVGTITANANIDYTSHSAIFYLKPNNNWKQDSARFAANFCNGNSSSSWMSMSETSTGSGIYWCYAPIGNYKDVIFCRMKGSDSTNNWDNRWNQTADLTLGTSQNYYKISESGNNWSSGTWSTYVPTPTAKSITANNKTIEVGGTVTFTPSITSKYAVIKSNSYSVTGGSSGDYTISNATNKITFNKAGTYTVTDTITYNAIGFTGITGTVTTSGVTITVNAKQQQPVASSVSLTASPSPGTKNSPISLTASLTGKNPTGNVTYTFSETSGKGGSFSSSGVTTSNSSTSVNFTPTATGNYTFKVVVSASGYTSVEKTVTVTVNEPQTASNYYLWYGQGIDNIENWTTKKAMISDGKGGYFADLDFTITGNYYFTVNNTDTISYGAFTEDIAANGSTVKAPGTSINNIQNQEYGGHHFFFTSRNTSTNVTIRFTFDPTAKKITLSNSDGSGGGGDDSGTVTQISSLTEKKQKNKIIANSNTSYKAKSAWIWQGDGDGKAYNLTEVGTVSSQYLSYYTNSLNSPNAILFQGTVTNGSATWPNNTRITSGDVKASNTPKTSADGNTTIYDGNYYFPVTSSSTDETKFTVFDHIGGTITPNKTEITLGESITLTGAATAGTLRKAKINAGSDKFTYVVRDSNGTYYRIGADKTDKTSVTWKPTVGGTYTVCGLVTDPFGFESMKVPETTVTVNDPVQTKYTVTYTAGTNGSLTCKQDTTNVPSGSQVVENSSVKFTITPDEGYEVDTFTVNNVDKKSSISNNTYTHQVTEDINVQVTFKKAEYNVTVADGISGGTITTSKTTANMGDNITITATPDMGYFLKSITVTKAGGGNVTCTDNSFTMPAGNVTVSATFITYKITGSITTAGTWDNFANGVSFDAKVKDGVYSKTITLSSDDLTEGRNKFRLIDSSSGNVIYRPSDSDVSSNGYLITQNNFETDAYSAVNGTSRNYFYFDKPGEYILYIKYDNSGPQIWVVKDKFALTATKTHCEVEFYSDSALTNKITQSQANKTVYVKVIPDTNYKVKTVTANSGVNPAPVEGKENVYSFTMPSADVNITATAETIKQKVNFSFSNASLKVTYTLDGTSHNNEAVNSGGTITVDKGKELSITGTPSKGYEAVTPTTWGIDPTPTPNPTTTTTTCKFDVLADTTVTYNTKQIDYSISYVYKPTQGGTSAVKVNGNAVTKLNIGDKFKVDQTVNTPEGYEIDSVVVTAGTETLSPDSDGIYTMTTGNVTVTTTYKAIKPTISECPASVELKAGETYTIPAKTTYGTLSYTESTGDIKFDENNKNVATAPNKEGTYTITVTATNQPTGITTAATSTFDITVIVKFTETQKAYKALEAKFAEIGKEKKEYYDTVNHLSEWTTYENAVNKAKELLETFPLPTATNTETYTNAQTALQNAYDAIQPYKKVNTIYVLSKYAPESTTNAGYVNIYMFNNTSGESYEPVDATPISEGSTSYAMTNLGTVQVSGADKYLYKFEYFGKGDFIVYVGSSSNSEITNSNKLTGDVKNCKSFTSYYLDLKNTSKSTINFGVAHSGTIVSPYKPLSVELTKSSDTCVEDVIYNLDNEIPKTEGGTLKTTSKVTVNHTYTDTLNGTTTVIDSPTTWKPTEPGVHTIAITSSTGVTTEDVPNTFTLYVQDKLDKPVVSINGVSDSNVTVDNETNVEIKVTSSGELYPDNVKYVFTVDGTVLAEQTEPTLNYEAGKDGALSLGNHTFSVKVIAPNTNIVGTDIKKYVDSDVSDQKTVTVKTVKYIYKFNFENCHISNNSVTYKLEGVDTTDTTLTNTEGITVDKGCTVTFTVTMSDGYQPIPGDNCWSGANTATISTDSLSYSFVANNDNPSSTIVFKSFLPAVLSPDSQDIKIGSSGKITIGELDSNTATTYQLLYKKDTETEFNPASETRNGKEFTTSNLEYGKYIFKVRQYTADYDYYSNEVAVNAVIGTIELKYYYQEYNKLNGLSYDPYIGKVNNLNSTATTYTITLEDDMSKALSDSGRVDLYKKNAPNINSNYFNYTLVTTGLNYETSTDNKKCTITGQVMTPTERKYTVSINGTKDDEFTSYYQQKTFLLDAAKYCSEGTYGYVWYNVKGKNKTVVSTDRYYKLRVARDTNLCVEALDTEVKTPTTIINEPVYNEYTTATNAVKVQMNMLVENYLPDDAVRTRTGVVYYAFNNDTTPPTIDSTKLPSLIANSDALANADAGKTCTVGTLNGTEIKGYYTANDNVNGKFIFGPIASITSTKTYVVYSYLTYIQDNVATTIVSNPVTASVKMYKNSIPTT